MSELKPCPFCGGEVKLDADDFYMFCCDKCGAGITFAKVFEDGTAGDCSEDESVTAWNRRAQSANEPLTLEQLREMDGEPVWLKDGIGEGWFLASAIVGEKIYFCEKSITVGEPITGCGKTWLAYRTKPEEVQA